MADICVDEYSLTTDVDLSSFKEDCRFLESLLDEHIRSELREPLYAQFEVVRHLSSCIHKIDDYGNKETTDKLRQELLKLIGQLTAQEAKLLTRVFGLLLTLTNIVETNDRIRRAKKNPQRLTSLSHTIDHLRASGVKENDILDAICSQTIEIVLTAHPTQVNRRSLQYKHARLGNLLQQLNRRTEYLEDQQELMDDLIAEVSAIWQTDEIRRYRPDPVDEARGGLHIVEQSLWTAVPQFLRSINRQLKRQLGEELPLDSCLIKFGSWMGGDRDGNPRITADVTRKVAYLGRMMAADLYLREIDLLRFELSMSNANEEVKQIAKEIQEQQESEQEPILPVFIEVDAPDEQSNSVDNNLIFDAPNLAQEDAASGIPPNVDLLNSGKHPYRVVLGEVRRKMVATRAHAEAMLNGTTAFSDVKYDDEKEIINTLKIIFRSLCECKGRSIAEGRLLDIIRRLNCFGLGLMKIDVRQDSKRHIKTIDAITKYLGFGSYQEWDEKQRMEFLVRELSNKRPLLPQNLPLEEEDEEILETFRLVGSLGSGSIGAYVVSKCSNPSDLLLVELLQKETLIQHFHQHPPTSTPTPKHVRSVPLFENKEDIQRAHEIIGGALSCKWYRNHLKQVHDDHQEVMLGYSNSSKSAGRVGSTWSLYLAQENLVRVCGEKGVKLTLFHGRGGSIGRGGSPMFMAINSQPPGSVQGIFRITEQGEMVQTKFSIPAMAQLHLETYSSAVLTSMLQNPNSEDSQQMSKWRQLMEQLSEIAYNTYRNTVESPIFMQYYQQATPQSSLNQLNIGSYPEAELDTSDIDSIRAITWQFAWTQTRLALPTWLGVGEALKEIIERDNINNNNSISNNNSINNINACNNMHEQKNYNVNSDNINNINACSNMHEQQNYSHGNINTCINNDGKDITYINNQQNTQICLNDNQTSKNITNLQELQNMYQQWPFFASMIDLVEMVLAKSDMKMTEMYDEFLLQGDDDETQKLRELGRSLRQKFDETVDVLKSITQHQKLCENNPVLKHLVEIRNPLIDPLNILQAQTIKLIRQNGQVKENGRILKEILLLTINGIAQGMRNTG